MRGTSEFDKVPDPGYGWRMEEGHPFPLTFILPSGALHLWHLVITRAEPYNQFFMTILSPDERDRASKFALAPLARRFIAVRGVLRLLLGRYLSFPPEKIVFSYEPAGKPRLLIPRAPCAFSLSHAGDRALFAFSAGGEIGVDLEETESPIDLTGVASYIFPPAIRVRLEALPPAERLDGFYRCWTRLEALAKASGLGLAAVKVPPGAALDGDTPLVLPLEGKSWHINDLALDSTFAAGTGRSFRAALCSARIPERVELFTVNASLLDRGRAVII